MRHYALRCYERIQGSGEPGSSDGSVRVRIPGRSRRTTKYRCLFSVPHFPGRRQQGRGTGTPSTAYGLILRAAAPFRKIWSDKHKLGLRATSASLATVTSFGTSQYRRLFSSVPVSRASPTVDPRDFADQGAAQVHGGVVHGKLVDRCPEFQLISTAVTLVAVVSSGSQIHGKCPAVWGC